MELTNQAPLILNGNTRLPEYEADKLPEKINVNDAAYGAFLSGDPDPLGTYENILTEMQNLGQSQIIDTLRNHYRQASDMKQAAFVEGLVADPTIDNVTKTKILKEQLNYRNPENTILRSAYLDTLANLELASSDAMTDDEANLIEYKIKGLKTQEDFTNMMINLGDIMLGKAPIPQLSDEEVASNDTGLLSNLAEKVWDPVIAEPAVLFEAFIIQLAPYLAELVGTGYIAATDGVDTNITEARAKARKVAQDYGGEWLLDTYHDFLGLLGIEKEDLEEAYATKAFTKLDEGLTWAAKKLSPNDLDLAKIPLEILTGVAIGLGLKKGPSFTKESYLRVTDPNAYQVYKLLQSKPDMTKSTGFREDHIFKTDAKDITAIPKTSVLDQTIDANKTMADAIVEGFITDEGNTAQRVTQYTVDDFNTKFILDKFIEKDSAANGFGATYLLNKNMELAQEQIVREVFLDNPYLKTSEKYKAFTEETVSVINDTLLDVDLDMNFAQSKPTFLNYGVKYDLVLNQKGYNFTNFGDANQSALALVNKVNKMQTDNIYKPEFVYSYEGIKVPITYNKATETGAKARVKKDADGKPIDIRVDNQKILKDLPKDDITNYKMFIQDGKIVWKKASDTTAQTGKEIRFNTKQEYVDFIVQHEIAHTLYPIREGQTPKQYENMINRIAYEKMEEIKGRVSTDQDLGSVLIDVVDSDGNVVTSISPKPGQTPVEILADPTIPKGPVSYQIRWTREGNFFDELKQLADEFNQKPYAEDIKIPLIGNVLTSARSKIFDSALWNWIAAFGKSSKALEREFTMSHQRAERIISQQLEVLADSLDLYSPTFRKHLHQLMIEQRNKADTYTIHEIRELVGSDVPMGELKALEQSLKILRKIDRFSKKLLDTDTINKAVSQGFKDYVDLTRADGSMFRVMVAKEFEFKADDSASAIFDMTTGTEVPFKVHQSNLLSPEGTTGPMLQYMFEPGKTRASSKQIVKLQNEFVDSNGRRYDYVLLDNKTKLNGVPDWIVPSKTGHISRISLGNFFVRLAPYEVYKNGNRLRVKDGESAREVHSQYSKAIAMFKTETDAKAWIEANRDKLPELRDPDYEVYIKKADELNSFADNMEIEMIRNATGRPARASNEHMYTTIYEDPLTSFILTSQRLGTDAMMQPILAQMRTRWVNAHKDKSVRITEEINKDNPFPKSEDSIKKIDGKEKEFRHAMDEWRRIDTMQAGHGGQYLARYFSMLADVIGEATDSPLFNYVSKASRFVQRNPNVILDYPRRVVTTAKITFAALWRNLTLQPIGIFGPMIVGPNSKRAFLDTVATIHYRIMQNKTFGKYDKINAEVFKYMYEQNRMSKSLDIGKDTLSQKDHMLILKHMQDSGYGVVSDHVLAKGLFNSSPANLKNKGLNSTFFRRAQDLANGYGKIGFELGEFMNRAGMWHASRQLWMENNPGMNWRTRKALDEITFDANQLAGSMIKQNTYAFQRVPILQYIGQFQAFGMKASESIWNKGASPYSAKQRAALAAYNLAVFGVRGGMIYGFGELIMNYLNATGNEDIAKKLDDVALTRLVINQTADAIMPTYDEEGNQIKSTADIAAVYSPFGTQFGGPYRDFWKSLVQLSGFSEVPNYQLGPATQTLIQGIDTYRLVKAMWADNTAPLDEKFYKSAIQLARITSGGSSLWNTFMYNQMNEKISKTGQSSGVPESNFDRFLKLFSVPNDKDRELFAKWEGLRDQTTKLEQMAEDWYQGQLILKGYDLDLGEITEAFEAANNLMELTQNEREIFWNHITVLDNRRASNTRFESFLGDVLDRHRMEQNPKYTKEEIQAMKIVIDQAPSGMIQDTVKELVEQLEQMKEE